MEKAEAASREKNFGNWWVKQGSNSAGANKRKLSSGNWCGGPDKISTRVYNGPLTPFGLLSSNTNHRACVPAISSAQKVPPICYILVIWFSAQMSPQQNVLEHPT